MKKLLILSLVLTSFGVISSDADSQNGKNVEKEIAAFIKEKPKR